MSTAEEDSAAVAGLLDEGKIEEALALARKHVMLAASHGRSLAVSGRDPWTPVLYRTHKIMKDRGLL